MLEISIPPPCEKNSNNNSAFQVQDGWSARTGGYRFRCVGFGWEGKGCFASISDGEHKGGGLPICNGTSVLSLPTLVC